MPGASICSLVTFPEYPMARVTVEDCLENVDNRFELVMLASKRAEPPRRKHGNVPL